MRLKVTREGTLLEHLAGLLAGSSRTTVKQRIQHGNARVNGKLVTNPAHVLHEGDEVVYEKQVVRQSKIKPPYPVIFEDESILVAVKPAGLLTVGARGLGGTSFYQSLLAYVRENSRGKERLYVVHRLDKEVSGILVFAKDETLQEKLKENWPKARKLYYALVEGEVKKDKGTIRSWLTEGHDQKVYSTQVQDGAKLAVTHYRVMDRTAGFTLLEVELETGRKNQIRVHLSEMGCPVVGDRRYGANAKFERRIRLHAFYLAISHPATEAAMEFKNPMPRGFLVLRDEDEKYK